MTTNISDREPNQRATQPKPQLVLDISLLQDGARVESVSLAHMQNSKPVRRADIEPDHRPVFDGFFLQLAASACRTGPDAAPVISDECCVAHNRKAGEVWQDPLNRALRSQWNKLLGYGFPETTNGQAMHSSVGGKPGKSTPLGELFKKKKPEIRLRTERLNTKPIRLNINGDDAPLDGKAATQLITLVPLDRSADLSKKYDNAHETYSALTKAVRQSPHTARSATIFLYSTFNIRPLIEQLLYAETAVRLYVVNPASAKNIIGTRMIESTWRTDLLVWAANQRCDSGSLELYCYEDEHAIFESALIENVAVSLGVYHQDQSGDGTLRRWSHDDPHSVAVFGTDDYTRQADRLRRHISAICPTGPIVTLSELRRLYKQDEIPSSTWPDIISNSE